MTRAHTNRILAIEIRANRLGFAVFEQPRKLRDFGAAWYDSLTMARSRMRRLLRLSRPTLMVLRSTNARYPRNISRRKAVARIARDEAAKRAIPITLLSEERIKFFFGQHTSGDKYDISAVVASWFPDIAWRLPSRPKFYDPEPRSILYFDSIALAIAYLGVSRPVESSLNDGGTFSPASK